MIARVSASLTNPAPLVELLAPCSLFQAGNWFGFVSTLEMASRLQPDGIGSGLTTALVLTTKLAPSFLLFPLAGAVADLYDRRTTMSLSCLLCSLFAAPMSLLVRPDQIWLLYLLLLLVNAAEGFYEPARRALVPMIVRRDELNLATSLDSLSWSVSPGCNLRGPRPQDKRLSPLVSI